jgi:hypothetical protein
MALQIRRTAEAKEIGSQWLRANSTARRTRRLPVVVISGGSCPGNLVLVHECDLAAVAAQIAELTASLNAG